MTDAYERFVLMYDMRLKTARKETELPDFKKVAKALLARVKAGKSVLTLRAYEGEGNFSPWLRIKDGKFVDTTSGEALALLFSIGDPRAANPVFEHSETAELREVEKQEKEGKALSAHCVISVAPSGPGRHSVLVEDVRGLGRTRLRDILASELKCVSEDFGLQYTNNSGDVVDTYIIPDLQGHMSEKISTSINRSTVSGVWLIDSSVNAKLDEVPEAKVARKEIKFDVQDMNVIEKISNWGKRNNYDKMRLVWNDPEGVGKPERASVDLTQKDVSDTYFVKQRKVKLSKPMPDAVKEMREEMIKKMLDIK